MTICLRSCCYMACLRVSKISVAQFRRGMCCRRQRRGFQNNDNRREWVETGQHNKYTSQRKISGKERTKRVNENLNSDAIDVIKRITSRLNVWTTSQSANSVDDRFVVHTGVATNKSKPNYSTAQGEISHIAQNIAETCQKYFQSFIATEIFSQNFFQGLQNISSQHYNFNSPKYFWNK